jgi:hypothetical protein
MTEKEIEIKNNPYCNSATGSNIWCSNPGEGNLFFLFQETPDQLRVIIHIPQGHNTHPMK